MNELYLTSRSEQELKNLRDNLKRDYEKKLDAINLEIQKWQKLKR